MESKRSDDTAVKRIWKILSINGTMDNMRNDLHKDPKFMQWQEIVYDELKHIIESDNSKTYEEIFAGLGGLKVTNSTDCNDKLENLLKQVVDEKLCTLPNGTKAEIFRKWDSIVQTHHWTGMK